MSEEAEISDLEMIPRQSQMSLSIVLVRDRRRQRCFMVWSYSDLMRLESEYEWLAEIGNAFLPEVEERQLLELGGDYPQLFWKLANFLKTRAVLGYWKDPDMFITLSATQPDEPCGLLGGLLTNGQYRLCLYFDKQSGRELAASFAADHPQLAKAVDEHRPLIEASCLPETGGAPVIELDHPTAWFLCWLFQMHLAQANRLP